MRTRVVSRTFSGPLARSARSRWPSAPSTERHGTAGTRHAVSGDGVPQIVVTIMLWRWSIKTKIWPSVPACCAAQARPGAGSPLMSAILPAALARAKSAGRPSPTSTSSPSSASTEVENECVSPSMAAASGTCTRPSSGKLM